MLLMIFYTHGNFPHYFNQELTIYRLLTPTGETCPRCYPGVHIYSTYNTQSTCQTSQYTCIVSIQHRAPVRPIERICFTLLQYTVQFINRKREHLLDHSKEFVGFFLHSGKTKFMKIIHNTSKKKYINTKYLMHCIFLITIGLFF